MSGPSPEDLTRLEDAFARGDAAAAAELTRALATSHPGDVHLEVAQARLDAHRGDVDAALAALEQLAEKHKKSGLPRAYLGALLSLKGEHKRAASQLEAALKRPGGDVPAARHALGASLLALGRYKEALPHLAKAATEMPSSSTVYFTLGRANELAQRWDDAERAYLRCIEIEPRYEGAFAAIVRVHATQGRFDLAERAVALGLEHNPGDQELMRFRVQLAFDQHDYAKAKARLLEIPEGERNVDDLGNLVMLAIEEKQTSEAEGHARAAAELAPDDWRPHWLLGIVLEGKEPQPRDEIIASYEQAIECGDPEGEAGARLGLVLLQGDQADPDAAAAALEDARERNPLHPGLLLHLALARANQGMREEAMKLARSVIAHARASSGEKEQAQRLVASLSSP